MKARHCVWSWPSSGSSGFSGGSIRIGSPKRMVTLLKGRIKFELTGCTSTVPITPTGITGTPHSRERRVTPVRPLCTYRSSVRVPSG